jgi:hypothetical protein
MDDGGKQSQVLATISIVQKDHPLLNATGPDVMNTSLSLVAR